jgi:peptidoglycan/LPS O-acetylase OafA/YrhL
MEQAPNSITVQKYNPAFDGIRGYGFLLVFIIHYFPPYQLTQVGSISSRTLKGMESVAFFAVPMFFVLSGYLIGGILLNTQNREGYFRVFYSRRVIRIFPLYYFTLLVIACIDCALKFPLRFQFWIHFLYIQNLFPEFHRYTTPVVLIQYWSLASEEQFYILWPLVVWLFPQKRKLLGIATFLVMMSCAIRLAGSHLFSSPEQIRYFSLTRADAILMGVVLGLVYKESFFAQIRVHAKWLALVGVASLAIWSCSKDLAWPQSFRGQALVIPFANITAVAVVIYVMEDNSWLSRVCSFQWIGWMGRMSYSLYIFHFTFAHWFWNVVIPGFAKHMPHTLAVLLSSLLAFALTLSLSVLSYRYIETPCQKLKKRVKYGAMKGSGDSSRRGQPVLAEIAS